MYEGIHSTAFSLGPSAGGGSLAETISFVPDTKAEFDIRVEPMDEPFPAIQLGTLTAHRRARSRAFWLGLGLAVGLGVGLVLMLGLMASPMRSVPVAERPARELLR